MQFDAELVLVSGLTSWLRLLKVPRDDFYAGLKDAFFLIDQDVAVTGVVVEVQHFASHGLRAPSGAGAGDDTCEKVSAERCLISHVHYPLCLPVETEVSYLLFFLCAR